MDEVLQSLMQIIHIAMKEERTENGMNSIEQRQSRQGKGRVWKNNAY